MLLSGFTFIRNALKYDYPIRECIESMLPLVDELVVNIGNSSDDTKKLIESISSAKIRIVESIWNDAMVTKGEILSEQTNIALDHCKGRWAMYLQADEAIHENDIAKIRQTVEQEDQKQNPSAGFRFRYLHFYGGYTAVQRPWNWYPSEVRLIRVSSGARSFGDAQTFRIQNNPMTSELLDIPVFHYGHARAPEQMKEKIQYFHRFWHGDGHGIKVDEAYRINHKNLVWYWGTHPKCYQDRIAKADSWTLKPNQVVPRTFKRVDVFCNSDTKDLADRLSKLLHEADPAFEVTIIESYRKWFSNLLFRKRTRHSSAVVNLRAEKQSIFGFLGWIIDARMGYRWVVAHAPFGRFSKFRSRLVDAINWGVHETKDQGFMVPAELHPQQLARWLGT